MICGDVELGEVVIIILDFRAFNDLITHTDKDALDFLKSNRIRVAVADEFHFSRQGHVDFLGSELTLHLLGIEFLFRLFHLFFDGEAGIIDPFANLRAVFRGDILHRL